MADFKKILRALLAKVTKKPVGDIDAILDASDATDESIVDALSDLDKARIAELTKPKTGQTFQDGYKKAKAEVLSEHEKAVKEKYEFEGDETGVDLVEAIVTAKAKTTKPAQLTDDDVKKHPVYQSAEKANKAALKAAQTEWEAKLADKDKAFTRARTFSEVGKKALQKLGELNPVLPANAKVAANLQAAFLKTFEDYEFELQDNGQRVVVMKDGKVVDDGHGNSLEFDKLVTETANGYFEFKANNGGHNANNGDPNKDKNTGAGGTGGKAVVYPKDIVKPTTWDGVMAIVNNTALPAADREIVLQTWDTEQAQGTK